MRSAIVLLLVVAMTACGGSASEVVGSLIEFDGDLSDVRSFTVLTEDGETMRFEPAADATFHGGPLSHLRDHLVSGAPIVVRFVERSGVLVATSVGDG